MSNSETTFLQRRILSERCYVALRNQSANDDMASPQSLASSLTFEVIACDGEARAGILTTRRGVVETPVFMPVGTAGTVKGIRFEELESPDLDAQIILGNTYHLWLRP